MMFVRRQLPILFALGFAQTALAAPDRVAEETVGLLTDDAHRAHTSEALRRVREQLGAPGASARAAAAVLDVAAGTSRRAR